MTGFFGSVECAALQGVEVLGSWRGGEAERFFAELLDGSEEVVHNLASVLLTDLLMFSEFGAVMLFNS